MGNEVKEQLAIKLAGDGFVGDMFEAKVQEIVAAIPSATRDKYSADPYEAAMQFYDMYKQVQGGTLTPGGAPQNPQPTQQTSAPTAISTAESKAIQAIAQANRAANDARTAATTIEKILIDKPDPKTYLDEKMTVVPTITPDKLKEYEAKLDRDDPENVKNFETLKAAVENKTPMAIYISKPQNKIIGYVIHTPVGETGSNDMETKTLTQAQMLSFVSTQLSGYVATREDSIGVKLRWNKPRKTKKTTSKLSTGTPVLMVAGKKEIVADGKKCEITSQREMNGDQPVMKPGKLRTNLSFRIKTDEKTQAGQPIYRTVRLTGDAQVPKFVRTTEEFAKIFGTSDKDRGVVTVPNAQEAAALNDAIINTISWMMNNGASAYGLESFKEEMSKQVSQNTVQATDGLEI